MGSINLQQQKLLELTSRDNDPVESVSIYNSRNYQSLLAAEEHGNKTTQSTIVEIIRAYQPYEAQAKVLANLQQQKLLELTSPSTYAFPQSISTIVEIIRAYQPVYRAVLHYLIYNSRNYQSLLAFINHSGNWYLSTIVEIIRAYQPSRLFDSVCTNLQQQKLLELTSPLSIAKIQKIL